MSTDSKIEFEVRDSSNRVVEWRKKSWSRHLKKRPELQKLKNKIKQAIRSPLHQETKRAGEVHFYSDLVRLDKRGNGLYLRVVVVYEGFLIKKGTIKTAFLENKF